MGPEVRYLESPTELNYGILLGTPEMISDTLLIQAILVPELMWVLDYRLGSLGGDDRNL